MDDLVSFDQFLKQVGLLASVDLHVEDAVRFAEASGFRPFDFFNSGEVVESAIIAYLLDPRETHGQRDTFLKVFLNALDLGINLRNLESVIIEKNAPCFSLPRKNPPASQDCVDSGTFGIGSSYRLIDILIQFKANAHEYVIAIESKSRGAGDQPNQIEDYLRHISNAYSPRTKYLVYLKDGKRPGRESIDPTLWETTIDGHKVCHAFQFADLMKVWLDGCKSECRAPRVRFFLEDFAALLGVETIVKSRQNVKVNTRIAQILYSAATSSSENLDFAAILAIYEMHEEIWRFAIANCMDRIAEILKEQLPDWAMTFKGYTEPPSGRFYIDAQIHRPVAGSGEPELWIGLETADWVNDKRSRYLGPTYLNLYIRKAFTLSTPTSLQFDESNNLWIGPRKSDWVRVITLMGIPDLRSAEGLRELVEGGAASHIATEVVRLAGQYQAAADACFPPHCI